MTGACQCLRVLYGSVQAAHCRDPVLASDRDLQFAIPVSAMPARQLPDGSEPVSRLCERDHRVGAAAPVRTADRGAGTMVAGHQRGIGPARADRIGPVLTAYLDARGACTDAAASIADVAAATRASSRVLALASAATAAEAERHGEMLAGARRKQPADVAVWELPDMPGPVGRSLQSLGVTSLDLLSQGAVIVRAGEQLLIDACMRLPASSLRPQNGTRRQPGLPAT